MKIFKIGTIIVGAIASCLGFAQIAASYPARALDLGYNLADVTAGVAYDSAGNTYVTGTSQYKYGAGILNAIWTMKLDKNGAFVWRRLGRSGLTGENDFAKGIAVDSLGNTYVAAEGNHTATTSSMLLLKYDAGGNIQWGHFYTEVAGHHNIPVGVGVDSLNRPYIGGTSGDTAATYFAIAQFSGGGVENWHGRFGINNGSANTCSQMKIMPNGDAYLAGSAQPATGARAAWYVKFNSAGLYQFDSGYTADSAVIYQTNALGVGSDGSVVLTGTKYPIDSELFAIKFSPTGVYQWDRMDDPVMSVGFPSNIGGQAAAIGPDGSVYVAGAFIPENGTSYVQGVLLKWDASGGYDYEKLFGSQSNQTAAKAMVVDAYSRVYIAYENSVGAASYKQSGFVVFDGPSGVGIVSQLFGTSVNLNQASGIAVDSQGQIYFSGTNHLVPGNADYLVGKYYQPVVTPAEGFTAVRNTTISVDAAHGILHFAHYVVAASAQLVSGASHGMVNLNADGSFSYQPNNGYVGTDQFTVKTLQGGLTGNTATVTINVVP